MTDDEPGVQDLKLVQAANRGLSKAWARGWLSEPPLDPDALTAEAERREKGKLEPGHWEEALRLLSDDLRETAALNPLGRSMAHGQLVALLRQRIRASRFWREHQQIVKRPIERPVIILGQMRSGTTLTHRLLACDPRFSFTRLHESLSPLVSSDRLASARATLVRMALHAFNPSLRSVHPTAAGAAEEEFGLHAFSLHGAMFEAQWNVPNFARWGEQRDLGPIYREFRQLLQTLAWRRGDPRESLQLLKAPQFMQDLHALLAEFPDARILMLVRDPAAVVASTASLVWHQRRIQSDAADPIRIGEEWRRKTRIRQDRAMAVLSSLPSAQWIEIEFDRLMFDWRGPVARIYDHLELPTSPELLSRMSRVASARSHHGHHYSPGKFGLQE